MIINEFQNYAEGRIAEGMVKIQPEFMLNEWNEFKLISTKEVFHFDCEVDANARIDADRKHAGFKGATKKHKEEKVSKKTGEIVSPEVFIVTISLDFNY